MDCPMCNRQNQMKIAHTKLQLGKEVPCERRVNGALLVSAFSKEAQRIRPHPHLSYVKWHCSVTFFCTILWCIFRVAPFILNRPPSAPNTCQRRSCAKFWQWARHAWRCSFCHDFYTICHMTIKIAPLRNNGFATASCILLWLWNHKQNHAMHILNVYWPCLLSSVGTEGFSDMFGIYLLNTTSYFIFYQKMGYYLCVCLH